MDCSGESRGLLRQDSEEFLQFRLFTTPGNGSSLTSYLPNSASHSLTLAMV